MSELPGFPFHDCRAKKLGYPSFMGQVWTLLVGLDQQEPLLCQHTWFCTTVVIFQLGFPKEGIDRGILSM